MNEKCIKITIMIVSSLKTRAMWYVMWHFGNWSISDTCIENGHLYMNYNTFSPISIVWSKPMCNFCLILIFGLVSCINLISGNLCFSNFHYQIRFAVISQRRVDKGEGQYSKLRHYHIISIITIFSIHMIYLDRKESYPSANRVGREEKW